MQKCIEQVICYEFSNIFFFFLITPDPGNKRRGRKRERKDRNLLTSYLLAVNSLGQSIMRGVKVGIYGFFTGGGVSVHVVTM